jgi:hypothetical protein
MSAAANVETGGATSDIGRYQFPGIPELQCRPERPPVALKDADVNVQADTDAVIAAVRLNGAQLEFAAPPLRANRAVVFIAVCNCGYALGGEEWI